MSTPLITLKLKDREVKAALAQLPPKVNERIRKRVARQVVKPFVGLLKSAWVGAQFRGKAPHRRAIASAVRTDVRRVGAGPSAPVRTRVGVDYSRKAARAKGRQRVFHLLEAGFRHKAGKKRIQGRFIAFRLARAKLSGIMQQYSAQVLREAKAALKGGPA